MAGLDPAIQSARVLRDAQLPHPEERPQGASRRTAAVLLSMRRGLETSLMLDLCDTRVLGVGLSEQRRAVGVLGEARIDEGQNRRQW